jgi:hypothetical protein
LGLLLVRRSVSSKVVNLDFYLHFRGDHPLDPGLLESKPGAIQGRKPRSAGLFLTDGLIR